MSEPYFSVVIPTYNRAHLINRTIAAVLLQRAPTYEVIVIDDGSTDNTEDVVRNYADNRIKYLRQSNKERGAARNAGVTASTGKYITFLDSDDIVYPRHLSRAKEKLEELGEPEIYHQAYKVVNEQWQTLSKQNIRSKTINNLLFTRGNVMSCIGVFVRRDVAIANSFNEDRQLTGVEDWELWIRLAAQYPIHYDNHVSSLLVQHAGRSVQAIPPDKLKTRIEKLLMAVRENSKVMEKFDGLMPQLDAVANSYISLHLSESGEEKREAIRYLFKAAASWPLALFQRRTLAILRNVLMVHAK